MHNVGEQIEQQPHRFHRKAAVLVTLISISTLVAVVWALSDVGQIDGRWGELALILFTWLTVVLSAWSLYYGKK